MKELLYDYRKLIERDKSHISGIWLGFQIFALTFAVIFGTVSLMFIHILSVSFDSNCILFPKQINYQNESFAYHVIYNTSMYSKLIDVPVDFILSQWADQKACYFPYYNPVLCIIFGIVWTTFFVMCTGMSRPWRIVVPAFVFCFGYSIICIVVASYNQDGTKEFIRAINNMTRPVDAEDDKNIHRVELYTFINVVTTWLYTSFWILATVVLILRCLLVADFQMIHVKVELIQPDCKTPSIVSEDFSPNESPTFPIHSLPSEVLSTQSSPRILKYPSDKPKDKKFVNLMEPADIKDSLIEMTEGKQSKGSSIGKKKSSSENLSKKSSSGSESSKNLKSENRSADSSPLLGKNKSKPALVPNSKKSPDIVESSVDLDYNLSDGSGSSNNAARPHSLGEPSAQRKPSPIIVHVDVEEKKK